MNNDLELNSSIAHYRIVSKIGAGGMGEVYLAHDTKLDRKVAIKFLNQEFSKDEEKLNRFIREARAASALNHPNILTVYEIGEIDGRNYITTELIDGHTLRQHLAQKEPLPLNTVLKIGVQVAEALSAAHQAGIIHRDIKPENIMIRRDGYAKVLDFGLAKLSEPPAVAGGPSTGSEDATRIQVNTNPGVVMGTVSYMSPEQARGNPTDARTDIWSLGVVLYEMLARKVPFTGDTTSHTIVSILEKEPRALDNMPAELQRIVRKALTKDADMRYQSARDLLIDLKNLRRDLDIQGELERSIVPHREAATGSIDDRATQVYASGSLATRSGQAAPATQQPSSSSSLEYAVTQAKTHKLATALVGLVLLAGVASAGYFAFVSKGGSKGKINSIAVLPFQNNSGNADSEYLSDGLTESLIYRLSQLPNLKVSPTSSVLRYKGKEIDAQKIANELGVNAVMSGRMIQRGDNLTISVELIDSSNNKLLWGEKYERKMADLLATQSQIAAEIVQNLNLELTGEAEQKLAKKYTENNDAYQLYLKGTFHYGKRTKDDLNKGIDYFQQAIKLDPKFALAYVGIAQSYSIMPSYSYLTTNEAIVPAKAASQKALEIDPSLADAHAALATTLVMDWKWADAEGEFKRALELNPNVADVHYRYGLLYLVPMSRSDEGIREIKRALELEPLSIPMNANLAGAYMYARQPDLALEQAKKTFDLDPAHLTARVWLANVYVSRGMYSEAIALSEDGLKAHKSDVYFLFYSGYAYAKTGRRADAEAAIQKLRALEKTVTVDPYDYATIYAGLGDKDRAFAELEKDFAERGYYLSYLRVDPLLDPLRDDPRFTNLVKRVGLPQ